MQLLPEMTADDADGGSVVQRAVGCLVDGRHDFS
jgi:hypothetical protein